MANPILPIGEVTGSFLQQEATTSSSSITYADSGIGYLSVIATSGAGEKQLEDFDLQEDKALQELFPEYSLAGIHIKKEPEDFADALQSLANSGLNTPPSSITIKSEPLENISIDGHPYTMEQLLDSHPDDFQAPQPSGVRFTYKNAIISCLQGGKKLTLQQLYQALETSFPDITELPGWKNSIRHNLSLNKKIFIHSKKEAGESGKGGYWSLTQDCFIAVKTSRPARGC
ncbi:hypothetical protein GCM10023116_27090 [Kistimonas scapharcae]|uniref:Fork-head domain-containing protein n=1 Tax=Kistimonas scapharcae TaxID=1036133 RepID=A0ABP8V3A1_9GAMM